MNTRAIVALVRNDLRLFFTDRRAVIVGVMVPIMLAAFFGYLFGGVGQGAGRSTGKVPIAVVDEDHSAVSRAITADLAADDMLDVVTLTRVDAAAQVKKGKRQVAAIFPRGFGEQSVAALFSGRDRPSVELLVDPSQAVAAQLARGLLAQYAMRDISREALSGASGGKVLDDYLARVKTAKDTPVRRELQRLLESAKQL